MKQNSIPYMNDRRGNLRIIGITGGIGSGKSSVSAILSSLGARVVDADLLAREAVEKGKGALLEIAGAFGPEILDNEGTLDRKKLAELVFGDKDRLRDLNRIVHKAVTEKITGIVTEAVNRGEGGILVLDVPIPVEHGFIDVADEIWVVAADLETRIKRVMARSGMSYHEVMGRINSQMSDEEYMKIADKAVYNNGSIEDLREKVLKLLD